MICLEAVVGKPWIFGPKAKNSALIRGFELRGGCRYRKARLLQQYTGSGVWGFQDLGFEFSGG